MKKLLLCSLVGLTAACTQLSRYEQEELNELKYEHGITVDNPGTLKWEKPKNGAFAAGLNLLPGIGNFYLCGADSSHCAYGALNLLFWPVSVLWAIPDGAISAKAINERDLLAFYKYGNKNAEKVQITK